MTVQAIQVNERRHRNALQTLGQGALTGAVAGYIGKYALPLTHEETHSDEYVKVMKKIDNQKTEYSVHTEKFLNGMKSKKYKSAAEYEFIKMFDGMKEGEHVKLSKIKKAIKTLEAKKTMDAADFRIICRETSKMAEKTAKQCINAYKLITKQIRPTGFFVATGAVAGAIISIIGNSLKTEVNS